MEIIIALIAAAIAFAAGMAFGILKANGEKTRLTAQVQVAEARAKDAQEQLDNERRHAAQLREESEKNWNQRLETLRQTMAQQAEAKAKEAQEQLDNERRHAAQLREESDKNWEQKLETLRQDMQKMAAEQLALKQKELQQTNRTQLDLLLEPIKTQFTDFKKALEDTKTRNEVNKKDLQDTFESTMKLFQQEQQLTVRQLREQTQRIGDDATNLTKALKGDSKIQGDWGEMVLESILESSGLRKDEEYFIQENTKDEQGRNFRPDVIVKFPEGRSVVIDSKVSLKAYADALATDDDAERDRLLREHSRSVRKHIDELAEKDYSTLVKDAIGFVLMFIPNETSYIAAMKQQPDLSRYAYTKHIIIISPSNLLMALQLAYNLWQNDRRNKNVEQIVKAAADLYDKVAGFADTFKDIGEMIGRLSGTFDKAQKQLYEGKGNVMKRVETLKELGVTPKKQIIGIDKADI